MFLCGASKMVCPGGVEPPLKASEASVCVPQWAERAAALPIELQESGCLNRFSPLVSPAVSYLLAGIEPATFRLSGGDGWIRTSVTSLPTRVR
jgi:hypothetical protein